jgi:hypothetical protein
MQPSCGHRRSCAPGRRRSWWFFSSVWCDGSGKVPPGAVALSGCCFSGAPDPVDARVAVRKIQLMHYPRRVCDNCRGPDMAPPPLWRAVHRLQGHAWSRAWRPLAFWATTDPSTGQSIQAATRFPCPAEARSRGAGARAVDRATIDRQPLGGRRWWFACYNELVWKLHLPAGSSRFAPAANTGSPIARSA